LKKSKASGRRALAEPNHYTHNFSAWETAFSCVLTDPETRDISSWRFFEGKSVRTFLLLFFLAPSLSAFGKSGSVSTLSAAQNAQVSQSESSTSFKQEPDDLKQELDVDALALSKIPADPIFQRDPLAPIFQPIDKLVDKIAQLERLKFGATYTFLNQYATITPDGVRHNQLSGCLDFTGAWVAYDDGSTAGSISLLVRSGSNIGISQQFNLSDRLGSGLYLNCLQGGGSQEPITVNILYWRQDFLEKRLSFYVGKIHPNEYISLSTFNNDERKQFLNGENDGNLALASEGTYAGGAQLSFRLRAMFTSTLSPWIRKVHSRVASKPSLIESTWKRQRWAGSPVPR
jgi:porin